MCMLCNHFLIIRTNKANDAKNEFDTANLQPSSPQPTYIQLTELGPPNQTIHFPARASPPLPLTSNIASKGRDGRSESPVFAEIRGRRNPRERITPSATSFALSRGSLREREREIVTHPAPRAHRLADQFLPCAPPPAARIAVYPAAPARYIAQVCIHA